MSVLEQVRELERRKQAILQEGIEKSLSQVADTLRELKELVLEKLRTTDR